MRRALAVVLFLSLAGCGNDELEPVSETMIGVSVTDNVPFAHESVQDILDRDPLPPQGDRAIPSHRIR